ncbi:MAG: LPS export ABC transporter permease LptF [Nitrospiraceae bacterium]|nr:LPS export ABC transporter permease LptF [Nitrospira sp.]MCB9776432.1 LPS export ABC transporter permease LptF [Nitrospiraceae bacterium]
MLVKYLIREVLKPSAVVCGLLVALFAGYSWVTFLAKAVNALLPVNMILTLIALKVGIALEVLIPISLYFGVILGFGRLYTDSEMKAFMACGVSPYRILLTVFSLSCLVAVLVSIFSLYLRPLAYEEIYRLRDEGEAGFRLSNLDAGHFYERRNGSLVFFAEDIDEQHQKLNEVFVQSEHGETLQVFSAKTAQEQLDPQSGISIPVLFDGFEYKLTREGEIKHISSFSRMAIYPQELVAEYRRKAESTQNLLQSDSRKDITELQWRFLAPFSAILMGLLGVPLSRASPRQGKYAKIFTATVIFSVYYFTGLMVRNLVEQGILPIIPGLWWIVLVLGALLAYWLAPSRFIRGMS